MRGPGAGVCEATGSALVTALLLLLCLTPQTGGSPVTDGQTQRTPSTAAGQPTRGTQESTQHPTSTTDAKAGLTEEEGAVGGAGRRGRPNDTDYKSRGIYDFDRDDSHDHHTSIDMTNYGLVVSLDSSDSNLDDILKVSWSVVAPIHANFPPDGVQRPIGGSEKSESSARTVSDRQGYTSNNEASDSSGDETVRAIQGWIVTYKRTDMSGPATEFHTAVLADKARSTSLSGIPLEHSLLVCVSAVLGRTPLDSSLLLHPAPNGGQRQGSATGGAPTASPLGDGNIHLGVSQVSAAEHGPSNVPATADHHLQSPAGPTNLGQVNPITQSSLPASARQQQPRACVAWRPESRRIWAGLLASIVFLTPCVLSLIYIVHRDRQQRVKEGEGDVEAPLSQQQKSQQQQQKQQQQPYAQQDQQQTLYRNNKSTEQHQFGSHSHSDKDSNCRHQQPASKGSSIYTISHGQGRRTAADTERLRRQRDTHGNTACHHGNTVATADPTSSQSAAPERDSSTEEEAHRSCCYGDADTVVHLHTGDGHRQMLLSSQLVVPAAALHSDSTGTENQQPAAPTRENSHHQFTTKPCCTSISNQSSLAYYCSLLDRTATTGRDITSMLPESTKL